MKKIVIVLNQIKILLHIAQLIILLKHTNNMDLYL